MLKVYSLKFKGKNNMNKVQILVNVVLVAAVAALFVLHFGKKECAPAEVAASSDVMPVAYLNVDSLLANYSFAIEASEQLMSKQEDARLKMNTKLRTFQNEVADFQRKLQNNAFLSRERAEKEQQRLAKKEQELQELEAKLTQDIMLENQKLNMQLADSLTNFLEIFNTDGRYHVILSNTAKDNVLMAAEQYDITDEVVAGMNARYNK
jgi:outer membrane protein